MRLWLGQMPACSGLSDTSPEEWRERQNQGRRGEDCGGDCVGLPEVEPVGRQPAIGETIRRTARLSERIVVFVGACDELRCFAPSR